MGGKKQIAGDTNVFHLWDLFWRSHIVSNDRAVPLHVMKAYAEVKVDL